MVNIIFSSSPPTKRRNQRGWWVHTGAGDAPFIQCATKREACELTAHLGREATRILRELNDIYRRATMEGQGLATAMTSWQVVEWNRLKGSFDQSFGFLAMRQSIAVPHAMTRLVGMARDIQAMSELVGNLVKVRFTGSLTAMQCCDRAARQSEAEIVALWTNKPQPAVHAAAPLERRALG